MPGGRAIRDDRNAELDSEYNRQARSTDTVTQKTFPTHSTSTLNAPEYCSRTFSRDSDPTSKRRSRELGQTSMHGTPSLSPTQHAQNGLRPVSSGLGAVRPRSRPHQTDGRPGLPELGSLQPITIAVHLSPNDKSDAVASRSPNRANRRQLRSGEAVQTRTTQRRSQEGALADPSHPVNKSASPHASTSTNHYSTPPASPSFFTSMSATTTTSLHTPMLPPMANEPPSSLNRRGSTRLSPSLVIRHHPMPILHLPTLPPPSPPARMHSRAHLRSVPALPVEGPGDDEFEADHENSGLGDSDDEDDDSRGQLARPLGDDTRQLPESYPSSHTSTRASSPYLSGGAPFLPAVLVDTSRLDLSFLDQPFGHLSEMPRGRAAGGPVDSTLAKTNGRTSPSLSPARTVRPNDMPQTHFSTPFRPTEISVASTGLEHTPSRASMYRLPSRSMVMLSPPRELFSPDATSSYTIGQILDKGKGRESSEAASTTTKPPEPRSGEPPTKNVDASVVGSPLRRMRSLPTFNRSSEPPPYPSFPLHHMSTVMPREEEGKERLPPYSNDIYLAAIMPRKMEFSAPGVQAKDRKWRRALCVLHGTVFKVYQCPRSVTGVGIFEDWWEKRVGVGDVSAPLNTALPVGVRASMDYSISRSVKLDLAAHPNSSWAPRASESTVQRTPVYSTSDLLQPPSQSHSYHQQQQRGVSPDAESNQRTSSSSYYHQYASNSVSSCSVGSSGPLPTSTSPSTISSYSQTTDPSKIKPSKDSLIRAYTMQHAESGLGNDYMKRKNVIRLRLEGEQFLLQAVDVMSVVEWIEVRG